MFATALNKFPSYPELTAVIGSDYPINSSLVLHNLVAHWWQFRRRRLIDLSEMSIVLVGNFPRCRAKPATACCSELGILCRPLVRKWKAHEYKLPTLLVGQVSMKRICCRFGRGRSSVFNGALRWVFSCFWRIFLASGKWISLASLIIGAAGRLAKGRGCTC